MNIAFRKLRPNRVFQHVVDQIQEAIVTGKIQPGDVLPPEMKLKDMFETSRGTVREALRVLEQKGLIETKVGVGGGAIVKEVNTQKMTESLDLLVKCHKVSLEQLAEFREEVEGITAALAAERATQNDIQTLKALLDKAHSLLEKKNTPWKEFMHLDIQVHITIAKIARNPVFEAVLHMVHESILGFSARFSIKDKQIENYQDLCGLIEAIEQGKAMEARSLAQQHVRTFTSFMKKKRSRKGS